MFEVLTRKLQADHGSFKWGASTSYSYYPKDNSEFFNVDYSVVEWLSQYTKSNDENFIRGFLGRMLFSGEESLKPVNVLSGGERVRCMLSRMMLAQPNVLILDEPTNHLDLESITALNRGMEKFKGTLLFSSYDHTLVETVATRIIEITPKGYIDRAHTTYDEYLSDQNIKEQLKELYS